ncbi:MAG TPA: SH3 domain-containing protein [Bacteriovoracaceae bacterium]|nr:SH3 domain-containing protein [Bacteriovoracaceae bacterium]
MKAFEDHLAKGETSEAQRILNEAKSEMEPSVYWFNQGLLHAKNNNWADARISLLKSQKLLSRQETISNLEIVEKQLVVSEVEAPRTVKDYLISSTYFAGSELALTLNLALLIIGLWNFRKTKSIRGFIGILIMMIMLSGLSLWTRNWPWVVAEEEITVLDGPSEIFESVSVIPKGIKFLGVERDSWVKVIYPSRLEGWIKKENISEL